MFKKELINKIVLFGMLFLAACDYKCDKTTETVTLVQNQTNREQVISVCYMQGYTLTTGVLSLSANREFIEASLGSYSNSEIRGGYRACEKVKNDKQARDIRLSAGSFWMVKLCFNATKDRTIIIENYQLCPVDFIQQTLPEYCDS